jgi:hypothetical protein
VIVMLLRRPTFLLMFILGCSLEPLPQSWQLDRVRLLGVKATPAEPRPGETTQFESLVYMPEGTQHESTLWFACLPEDSSSFGCTLDSDAAAALESADSEELSDEELYAQLIEAGLIGAEPYWAPSWTPPADALDALSPEEQIEGLSATVNVTLLLSGEEDAGDPELAFKRVPVSLATHPNHNPEIVGLRVDDEVLRLGAALNTVPGAVHTIEPVLSDDSIETYTYVDSSGVCEERIEAPYFTWYTEGGQPDSPFTLYPFSSIEWTAPETSFSGLLVVVARDRRGGMAWAHLDVVVED